MLISAGDPPSPMDLLEEFEKKEKPYLMNQCFFCQFCDVAKEAMIHKKN
jgi:hypothetical protein